MDLTEAGDIKKRWQEHTELYKRDLYDLDNHDGVITHLELDILECEVKWVLGRVPTNKRAHTVAQILLTEFIPRFGLPSSLQSDNGLEFTSKVTQQLSNSVATAEFSKVAGILSAALSQHHLSGFEIAQLESHHLY